MLEAREKNTKGLRKIYREQRRAREIKSTTHTNTDTQTEKLDHIVGTFNRTFLEEIFLMLLH